MELKDIIQNTKQSIKDISSDIRAARAAHDDAKTEGRRLREELKQHMAQVWACMAPEYPKKSQLQQAIAEKHLECCLWRQAKLRSRPEARYLMLAYAFMRGKAYKSIERSCKEEPAADCIWAVMPGGVSQVREPSIHKHMIDLWLKGEFALTRPEKLPEPLAAVA